MIPVILSPQGSVYRTLALETLDKAGIKYRVTFSSRSYVSKIAAAKAGIGFTIMQKSFLSRKQQNLHVVPNLPPLGVVNLCILNHSNNPTIEYLVKLLLQLMQGAF